MCRILPLVRRDWLRSVVVPRAVPDVELVLRLSGSEYLLPSSCGLRSKHMLGQGGHDMPRTRKQLTCTSHRQLELCCTSESRPLKATGQLKRPLCRVSGEADWRSVQWHSWLPCLRAPWHPCHPVFPGRCASIQRVHWSPHGGLCRRACAQMPSLRQPQAATQPVKNPPSWCTIALQGFVHQSMTKVAAATSKCHAICLVLHRFRRPQSQPQLPPVLAHRLLQLLRLSPPTRKQQRSTLPTPLPSVAASRAACSCSLRSWPPPRYSCARAAASTSKHCLRKRSPDGSLAPCLAPRRSTRSAVTRARPRSASR
jgi:hypothetical protein